MNKILIVLVWLLGLAAIALLCNRQHAPAQPLGAKLAAPAGTSGVAETMPGLPASAPSTAAAPAAPATIPAAAASMPASPVARAAALRIDEVLKNKVVAFGVGSAVLTGPGRATLADIRAVLKDNPSLKFQIEGHTDAIGNEAANRALSQARAEAVKQALVAQGVAPDRLTAKGYGSSRPVADNRTTQGRARNRRIAFSIEENK